MGPKLAGGYTPREAIESFEDQPTGSLGCSESRETFQTPARRVSLIQGVLNEAAGAADATRA